MVIRLKSDSELVSRYKDLTPGNLYRVIEISQEHYRILNDEGLPYLFEVGLFDVLSEARPDDWITEEQEGRITYEGPACLSSPGFFEDFFDGDAGARKTLRKRLQRW